MNTLSLAAAAAFALAAAGAANAATPATQPAATSQTQAATSANQGASADSQSMKSLNQHSLRAELMQHLSNNGFTDIKIMPSSFYIQAKNKNGEPVAMVIGPDSFTEVTEVKTQASANSQSSNKPQASATQSQTKKN